MPHFSCHLRRSLPSHDCGSDTYPASNQPETALIWPPNLSPNNYQRVKYTSPHDQWGSNFSTALDHPCQNFDHVIPFPNQSVQYLPVDHNHVYNEYSDLQGTSIGNGLEFTTNNIENFDFTAISDIEHIDSTFQGTSIGDGFDFMTNEDEPFIPFVSRTDFTVTNHTTENSYPALQFPDIGFNDDFDFMTNDLAISNSFAYPDEFTTNSSFSPAASIPATPNAPVPIARAPSHRSKPTKSYACDYLGCHVTASRPDSLARHRLQHGPPQHPCPVEGCKHRGSKGFYRVDTLRRHQKKHEKIN